MESGFTMFLHAAVIAVVLYLLMRHVLGQSPSVAEDRSVLIGAVVLAYMVLFGHGMPKRVNPRIF